MAASRGKRAGDGLGNPRGLSPYNIVGAGHHPIVVGAWRGEPFGASKYHQAITSTVVNSDVPAPVGRMSATYNHRHPIQIIRADRSVEFPVVIEIRIG